MKIEQKILCPRCGYSFNAREYPAHNDRCRGSQIGGPPKRKAEHARFATLGDALIRATAETLKP